ncbi:PilZ domain-containing protein [Limimaricola sp.]|uniref:PilZ domain-containing protein n=1 Tax=Limimaricola sp. TaxID=2211665 RepID=UPI004058F411
MRIGPVLLMFILFAAPLRADPACDAIAGLERVVTAARAGSITGLDRALRRIDLERVMWDIGDHPLARQRETIGDALTLVEAVRDAAGWTGPAAAARLREARSRIVLDRLGALLARHGCADGTGQTARAAPGSVAGSEAVRWAMPRLAEAGIALLAMAGFGAVLVRLMVGRSQLRARQAQRHVVNLPARVRGDTGEIEARLLDISRLGAKLRVDPAFEPEGLTRMMVLFGDREIEAALRWRTTHYLGVQFAKPLSAEAMAPLIQPLPGDRRRAS